VRSLTFVPALSVLGVLIGSHGCAATAPRETTHTVHEEEPLTRPPPSESLSVSGLRGTLSQQEIEGALRPRLPKFLRCAQQRLGDVEVLAGSITLAFHVATNGAVPGVSPIASSLGDRETERCMLEVAQSTRFPPPHGGEADFTWPLELPGDPDVRAPVALSTDAARSAIGAKSRDVTAGESLHASCGGGQMVVTAYVDTSGAALAVGVSTPDLATPTELDCIANGVRAWTFDSPGSYVGKVTFSLP
jgi:hypothetical protein